MRSSLPWHLLLALLGLWPMAAAWSQGQPAGALVASEQPAADHPPAPSGQQPGDKSAEPGTAKTTGGPAVEASPLDTFLLRDSKGNLVPVVGMTFEEFEKLQRLKMGLASPAPPAQALESLSLSGTADAAVADLKSYGDDSRPRRGLGSYSATDVFRGGSWTPQI